MIAQLFKSRRTANSCKNGRGWIGIDLQPQSIRIAQVVNSGGVRRLDAAYSIDLSTHGVTLNEVLKHNQLKEIFLDLKPELDAFGRANAAAVLPTSATRFHQFTLPKASRSELTTMINGEIQSDYDGTNPDFSSDYWTIENTSEEDTVNIEAVSLPVNYAESIIAALQALNWNCRVIDARTTALARLANSDNCQVNAILECGLDESTFVIAENGLPIYSRILRNCGVRSIIDALVLQSGLGFQECLELMERASSGYVPSSIEMQNATVSVSPAGRLAGIMEKSAKSYIEQICDQLRTTLEFARFRLGLPEINRVFFAGFGPLITGMLPAIQGHLNVSIEPWMLNSTHNSMCHSTWSVAVSASEIGLS